ncbi:MAG: hypothetical protein B6I26_05635 [Desulfobacteraceae bacterium 4572_130]|nr:MAG: hypothetical protein B6I26_05635 [Desulfobacteraceae bacterium 4572_130]
MTKNIINNMETKNYAAIIGMGCIFPKANGLKQYWRLLFNGQDAITEIPETHWSIQDYFNEDPLKPDHTYCKKGGFIPFVSFDPAKFGIPPNNLNATDTSQLLGLIVAQMALEDAGYSKENSFNKEKTSIILGVTGTQELVIPLGARLSHPIWKKALKDSGISKEKTEQIIEKISNSYAQWQENSFPGLLGNVVAGRIANKFDLGGTNSVVDAACASSLSAINIAVMELMSGRCDMTITGGVDTLNDIFMHMCFSKTKVLSHTSDAKPFSKYADGTVLGEGIGMLVLKRLNDAKKDNDRIYAVIKGIGTSSDGKTSGIYAPDVKGQIRALKSAYKGTSIKPDTIELIEAHGTGTRVGDKIEFTALKEFFSNVKKNQCMLGSVKSMIGHAKAAAGVAGIIKSALGLYHKVLPPTLKAEIPDPDLDIKNTPFYLNSKSKPWIEKKHHPRRAGVSAFGFGGSNFHVSLEEYKSTKKHISWDGTVQIACFSANTKKDLKKEILEFKNLITPEKNQDSRQTAQNKAWETAILRKKFSSQKKFRLLFIIKENDDPLKIISKALALLESEEKPSWKKSGIFFGKGEKQGRLGFLFPGQGSQYLNMGKDIISIFPQAMDIFSIAEKCFSKQLKKNNKTLKHYIFPAPEYAQDKKISEQMLRNTNIAQPAIGTISIAMEQVLKTFGIKPDMTCGHSFGELCALCSANWITKETFFSLSCARGEYMAQAFSDSNNNLNSEDNDSGSMVAIKASLKDIKNLIKNKNLDLIIANKNSFNQGVVSGKTSEIKKIIKICKQKKISAIKLPVAAAFHSSLVEKAASPFKEYLNNYKISSSKIPVFSNTTGDRYPDKEFKAKEILGNQLLNPVDFIKNIQNMFQNNVTTFLEVGPKTVLTGLVKSILKNENFNAISVDASSGKKTGIEDLGLVLCELASLGFKVNLLKWEDPPIKPHKNLMNIPLCGANIKPDNDFKPLPDKSPEDEPLNDKDLLDKDKNEKHENFNQQIKQRFKQSNPDKGTSSMTYHKENIGKEEIYNAMNMLGKGLKSIESLQLQTAKAHEKFLETQQTASKTLQAMMEQTRIFAGSLTGCSEIISGNLQHSKPVSNYTEQQVSDPENMESQNIEPKTINSETIKLKNINSKNQNHTNLNKNPNLKSGIKPNNINIEPYRNLHNNKELKSNTKFIVENNIKDLVFETVSSLTGFPVEMLELDMDIETDLGIDSIKRVEIISDLEGKRPDLQVLTPENMGTLKTLNDICTALGKNNSDLKEVYPCLEDAKPDNNTLKDNKNEFQKIMDILINTVSSLTGFPKEMLEPHMELESDLGIDSIKKVEILSDLEEKLPDFNAISSKDMVEISTLSQLVKYIIEKNDDDDLSNFIEPDFLEKKNIDTKDLSGIAEPKKFEKSEEPEKNDIEQKKKSAKELLRQTINLKKFPIDHIRFYNGSKITISENKKVYITNDDAGVARIFKNKFLENQIKAEIINLNKTDNINFADAAGLIIISNSLVNKDKKTAQEFLKSSFLIAKKCAPYLIKSGTEKNAFFATVSFLGGNFGFSNKIISEPVQGGLAGLSKTFNLECENVLCKSLDMADTFEKVIENVEPAVSLLMTHGFVEIGIKDDFCFFPEMITSSAPKAKADINKNDVIVIAGGAKGITFECALEIAKQYSPKIILLGKSQQSSKEPEWIKKLSSESEIKKAILKNKFHNKKITPLKLEQAYKDILSIYEINKNLKKIKSTGSKVKYFSLNICDEKMVNKTFKEIRKDFGKITGVIHGAGMIEDKLIQDKTLEQFNLVFDTKVKGLNSLISATKNDNLKYFIMFSSIAARTGNKGQVDYAMANEVLNKTAQKYAKENQNCRVISFNWGPWAGGMINNSLKKEFEKKGIDLIPLEQGAKSFVAEMGIKNNITGELNSIESGPVEVIIGASLIKQKKIKPERIKPETIKQEKQKINNIYQDNSKPLEILKTKSALVTAFKTKVGIDSYPILKYHKIANKPVVPFALIMEWFAYAAEYKNPGLFFAGLNQMRIFKGIKLDLNQTSDKSDLNELNFNEIEIDIKTPDKLKTLDNKFEIDVYAVSQKDFFLYSKAKTILKEKLLDPPVYAASNQMHLKPYSRTIKDAYDDILFHENKLKGIKSIIGCSTKGIEVLTSRALNQEKWIKNPYKKQWLADPLIIDSAFQAASLWSYEITGKVCLPSYIANFEIYSSFAQIKENENVKIILTINEQTKHIIKGYFTFINNKGIVIASITGFEAVTDSSLFSKFKPELKSNLKKKKKKEIFTKQSILSFAKGKPSNAFGEKYKIFDKDRKLARLPSPPYLFIDRIIKTEPVQWKIKKGGWVEAEFDIPVNGWYFKACHSNILPFCILLETALQTCGWHAAYAGSALQSNKRLFFRNLGGQAKIIKSLNNNMGTITMRSCLTNISKTHDMIIQDFDMQVLKNKDYLYKGQTSFGFFTKQALSNQTGIKNKFFDYVPSKKEIAESQTFEFKDDKPFFPDDLQKYLNDDDLKSDKNNTGMHLKALRMVDKIDTFIVNGGKYKKGYIKASKKIVPNEWFFKAHFYQDPVCPGSLGIESFLQLINFFALKTIKYNPDKYQIQMKNHTHKWIYRGQIVPTNKNIEIHAHIKKIKKTLCLNLNKNFTEITAQGFICVDGLPIYEMDDFSISVVPVKQKNEHQHFSPQKLMAI